MRLKCIPSWHLVNTWHRIQQVAASCMKRHLQYRQAASYAVALSGSKYKSKQGKFNAYCKLISVCTTIVSYIIELHKLHDRTSNRKKHIINYNPGQKIRRQTSEFLPESPIKHVLPLPLYQF